MPKLRMDPRCEEEIEDLEEDFPKLHEKVEDDLEMLEYYGYKSIAEPGRPPHTETYEGNIRYVKTRQSNNHYRVYFFLTGDFVICLLGWLKKRNDISQKIKNEIEKRYEHWKGYLGSD